MDIVGIDISSKKLSFAQIRQSNNQFGDLISLGEIKLTEKNDEKRIAEVYDATEQYIIDLGFELKQNVKVLVEKPFGRINWRTTTVLTQVATSVLLAWLDEPCQCNFIDNQTWKTAIGGRPKKADIKQWVIDNRKDLPDRKISQDEYDAIAIAMYGISRIS